VIPRKHWLGARSTGARSTGSVDGSGGVGEVGCGDAQYLVKHGDGQVEVEPVVAGVDGGGEHVGVDLGLGLGCFGWVGFGWGRLEGGDGGQWRLSGQPTPTARSARSEPKVRSGPSARTVRSVRSGRSVGSTAGLLSHTPIAHDRHDGPPPDNGNLRPTCGTSDLVQASRRRADATRAADPRPSSTCRSRTSTPAVEPSPGRVRPPSAAIGDTAAGTRPQRRGVSE
jgi:hypothetical protein